MKYSILLGFLTIWIQSIAQIPEEGMVGRWTFSGNTNEINGTGNDGSNYGAVLVPDRCEIPNSAYYFDGDDYIECTTDDMGITDAISISLWFNTGAPARSLDFDALVTKYSWTEDYGYAAQFDNYNAPEIRGRDGNDVFSESNSDAISRDDGQWHHFVGIVNGSVWTSYIDNIFIASYDNGHENVDIGSCSLPLTFGRLSQFSNTSWRFYEGSLDDITIYNRPLNEDEIEQLFMDDCLPSNIAATKPLFQLTLSPNPTIGQLRIDNTKNDGELCDLRVVNYMGQEVPFTVESTEGSVIIDIGHNVNGIYHVLAKIDGYPVALKVVLQKM